MGKVKFKLDLVGLNQLMKSQEMRSALEASAQEVASMADGNYNTATHVMNYIAQTNVYPADRESAIKNARNNELLKAIGAAGLSMER